MRWKVASDLRFRVAISVAKTPSFCEISGDLAPSTWKSLAIAIPSTRGPPDNGNLIACWVCCDAQCGLSCLVLSYTCTPTNVYRRVVFSRPSSGTTNFWGFYENVLSVSGYCGFGAVGKAGELRLLGAFLPKTTPQKNRGVPWAPSPLCFLTGVLVAVLCCKVLPQKNLCCLVFLLPFKKSAMFDIYICFRGPLHLPSSSFCFFLLFLSCFVCGGGSAGCSTRRFCCGLTSTTAVAGCFCFRVSGTTRAQDDHLPHLLRGVVPPVFFGRFFVFWCSGSFLFLPKWRFCSCFCRLFRAWCFPSGVGWGVLGVSSFSPPFPPPPPPCCLLRLASTPAARCLRKLGGSARNGPDPPPALGLARVASRVSCWESSATRAEPKAGGVFGFIATPSTTMITTLLPRGGGIHPQQNPAVSSEPGFVGSFCCWFAT